MALVSNRPILGALSLLGAVRQPVHSPRRQGDLEGYGTKQVQKSILLSSHHQQPFLPRRPPSLAPAAVHSAAGPPSLALPPRVIPTALQLLPGRSTLSPPINPTAFGEFSPAAAP
jgi:hypothetical protein